MIRVEESGAYPARRTVHRISFSMLDAHELLFLPFEQFGQYFGQGGRGVRTLPAAAGGVIFPIVVPHRKSSVLEWLDPPHYGGRHYFDYRISGLGEHLYLAQELANLHTMFLLEAPRAPAVAFLQMNTCELRKTPPG